MTIWSVFMTRMTIFFALSLVLAGGMGLDLPSAQAREWWVPQQAPTIQAAVDSCVSGDVVVISPGIYDDCTNYSENVNHIVVLSDGVSLRGSTGDPADVILDAGYQGRCLEIRSLSGDVVIEGLTLRRGKSVSPFGKGGAAFSIFSSPTFRSCVFDSNQSDFGGSALSASYGSLTVEDCLFTHNSTEGIGAAVQVSQAPTTISGCTIFGSTGSSVHYAGEVLTLSNTIITEGDAASISRNSDSDPAPVISCSNFFGNETDYPEFISTQENSDGNISQDPLFCNSLFGDFTLYAISPCTAENSGDCGRIGLYEAACGFGAVTWMIRPDGLGDFPTIQDAVNASTTGDTIALADGVFMGTGNRDVDLLGKELTIKGASGDPELVVIDCQGTPEEPYRAFLFQDDETEFTVLRDLTITGGEHPGDGGAIYCESSPRIENVVFHHNGANRGGAIFVQGGSPKIDSCTFVENRGDSRAGGVALYGAECEITNSLFTANWGYIGSAVFLPDSSTVALIGCTVTGNNSSLDKDCLGVDGNSHLVIRNSQVTFNSRHAARNYGDGTIDVVGSNVYGNAEGNFDGAIASSAGISGNISADPLYCDSENRQFTMRADSPCTDYNAPDGVQMGAFGVQCDAPEFFTDMSASLPQSQAISRGVSVVDINNDGNLDFMVANEGTANEVMLGDGSGGFSTYDNPLLNLQPGYTTTTPWGDFDNDGDWDVYLGNSNLVNMLATNFGDHFNTEHTTNLEGLGESTDSTWIDYDGDGNLDLLVASMDSVSTLIKGDGEGGFAVLDHAVLDDLRKVRSTAWADFDNDGDQDVYLMKDGEANVLLENDGEFVDATSAPLGLTGTRGTATWGDFDNDGNLDLLLVRDQLANSLLRNKGDGSFESATDGPLERVGPGRSGLWGDWDNDGDLDVFITQCGQANQLLRNEGGGRFINTMDATFAATDSSTGAAFADFDKDGDLDLLIADRGGQTRLFRNDQTTGNNWLRLNLTRNNGQAGSIGARVTVKTDLDTLQIREVGGGGWLSSSEPVVHFGLGVADTVREVSVTWPGGETRTETDLLPNQVLNWVEPDPGPASGLMDELPSGRFRLFPAHPNPFNPATALTFELPARKKVTLEIFDLRGRLVKRLLKEDRESGYHVVQWRGRDEADRQVAAGVYLVRLKAGEKTQTQGITLVK